MSGEFKAGGGDFGGGGASADWHDEPLTFADIRLLQEWESGNLSNMTRLIVLDAASFASNALGWIFKVTSIWRSRVEDAELGGTGIHPAWRAVDVRTKDRPPSDVDRLAAYLNGRYVYDPVRPTKPVAYARLHGSGPHVHIQSHNNTIERTYMRGA